MIDPSQPTATRLLLGAAALLALVAALVFFIVGRDPSPLAETDVPAAAPSVHAENSPIAHAGDPSASPPAPLRDRLPSGASAAATPPLVRTPEGRIAAEALATFTPQPYPGGTPHYEGEPVTAYIAIASTGKRVALTVNQMGEFPRIQTELGEEIEVRLAFTSTEPGTPVAIAARDGGKLHTGKLSTALQLDDARQTAFGFAVSGNVGLHQISVTTPGGEMKTLEFWAGPPPILMQAAK